MCVRSDSYLGYEINEDIKLDVQQAPEPIEDHPQWEFEDEEEEDGDKEDESEDEFATDDEDEDDDDEE